MNTKGYIIRAQKNKALGRIGENVTKKLLLERGFTFVSANYRQKCGEIDLIMAKNGKTCFFEVKTVSRESFLDISRETALAQAGGGAGPSHRAEDNLTPSKLKKIARTIKMWMVEQNCDENMDWNFNVALVYAAELDKRFYVKFLWDVVL